MNILVIDGHGGMLGAQLVKEILTRFQNVTVNVVGTNTVATAAMLKAGAHNGATGENPVVVGARKADVIIGPIGIVIADSLSGEITPKMAVSVGSADAIRILIPMNKCDNMIAGINGTPTSDLIEDVISKLNKITTA